VLPGPGVPPATLHPLYLLTIHHTIPLLARGAWPATRGPSTYYAHDTHETNDIYQVLQGPGVPPVDVLCGTLEICSYAASVVRDGRLAPATFR